MTVATVFIFFGAAVYGYTYTFPARHLDAGVAAFPRLLTAIMVVLAVMLLFLSKRSRSSREFHWDRVALVRIGVVSLLIVAYIILIRYVGFLISTLLFLAVLLWYFRERRPVALVVLSLGITASIYVVFGVLAGVPFPVGLLFY